MSLESYVLLLPLSNPNGLVQDCSFKTVNMLETPVFHKIMDLINNQPHDISSVSGVDIPRTSSFH